jgi:hypothetical protein
VSSRKCQSPPAASGIELLRRTGQRSILLITLTWGASLFGSFAATPVAEATQKPFHPTAATSSGNHNSNPSDSQACIVLGESPGSPQCTQDDRNQQRQQQAEAGSKEPSHRLATQSRGSIMGIGFREATVTLIGSTVRLVPSVALAGRPPGQDLSWPRPQRKGPDKWVS